MESRPRDSQASEEMRELALEVVLPFPGGFLLCVICPLDLVKLDRALTGDSGGFFQDTKGCLTVCQILDDGHRAVIDVLENIGLVRHLQTLPEQRYVEDIVHIG